MAIQTGKIRFTGRLGDLIGYYRNGVHCLRSMPLKVKQTKASVRASHKFGAASSNGKLIRQAFGPHLYVKKGTAWVNQLNSALIRSGVQHMKGYSFNQFADIKNFFAQYSVDENNTIHIPAQALPNLPRKVTHLEVKLITARIDFDAGRVINTVSQSQLLDPDQPFEGLSFNTGLPGRGTLLIVLQVNAFQDQLPLFDKRYMAADLIAIQVPAKQTISRQQRKQGKKIKPVKQLQTLQQKQSLPLHTAPVIDPADNFCYNRSRLKARKE